MFSVFSLDEDFFLCFFSLLALVFVLPSVEVEPEVELEFAFDGL